MDRELVAAQTDGQFKGRNGPNIYFRSYRPACDVAGVVVIVPGFNSHGGYYHWVAKRLTGAGLAVDVIDLQGRGKSDGERFYIERFDDYAADVGTLITMAKSRDLGLPVFLLGHSAGGVVSCLYALDHQHELAGLICESFAFELPAPDFVLAVMRGLSHVAPHARVLALKNETFSRDPEVVAAMNADPLIAHETQPTSTMAAMVRADERLRKELSAITLPVLILHGTRDTDAKPDGSKFFYETSGSTDKTLKIYEGYLHDLLNDTGKEIVMTDIENWIAAQLK